MPASHLILATWLTRAAWILAWSALTGLTILLVVLLRTRWRDVRSWKKCAIGSLWVHVLLACLMAMVRIASSGPGYGPGYGPGESIRVSLLPAEFATAAATDAVDDAPEPDAAPEVVDDEPVADALESEPAEPEPSLEAPTLLAAPQPPPEDAPTPAENAAVAITETPSNEEISLEPAELTEPESQLPAEHEVASIAPKSSDASGQAVAPTLADLATTPSSPRPTARRPAAYANRSSPQRAQIVASGGGNGQTEAAVQAALQWLADAQSEDGRWDAKRHGAGRERYAVLGQDRGATGAKADTGVSGLALLAMLGAGNTHEEGDYAENVERGLAYLRSIQRENGDLSGDAEFFARMYCHSMAAFALSEAHAMTHDAAIRPAVERAASYSLKAQHGVDGGWRYLPGQEGDTSQLGWQLMALESAAAGGVDVPAVTWTRSERFLRHVERGHAGGLAAYQPNGPPTRSMTAEAMFCRQLLAARADGGMSAAALSEAVDSLLKEPPTSKPINLYYWYYATLALHGAQDASPTAAAAWRQWNESLVRTLLATQNADGSWSETCIWGGYGGRVFTTSLACMCLEAYYRYAPPPSEADIADRGWQAVPR